MATNRRQRRRAEAETAAPEEEAAETFIRCLLEEHGALQTMVLHRQSLGSALDASALGAAWGASLPGGSRSGAVAGVISPPEESLGAPPGWLKREQNLTRLRKAYKDHDFRDIWFLSTATLLDRAFTALGPAHAPSWGAKLGVWLLTASLVALKMDNAETEKEDN